MPIYGIITDGKRLYRRLKLHNGTYVLTALRLCDQALRVPPRIPSYWTRDGRTHSSVGRANLPRTYIYSSRHGHLFQNDSGLLPAESRIRITRLGANIPVLSELFLWQISTITGRGQRKVLKLEGSCPDTGQLGAA